MCDLCRNSRQCLLKDRDYTDTSECIYYEDKYDNARYYPRARSSIIPSAFAERIADKLHSSILLARVEDKINKPKEYLLIEGDKKNWKSTYTTQ